jgi:hypothetical protein
MSVLIPESTINYGILKRDFPNKFGGCFGKINQNLFECL